MNNNKENTVFITGACGMVGSHLVEYYADLNINTIATYYTHPTIDLEEIKTKATFLPLDVRDLNTMTEYLTTYKPSIIYHLAAQSFPTISWEKPQETIDININGTINVFEAIKSIKNKDHSYDPIVVIACSSAEYGSSLTPENIPIHENIDLLPLHPYGVSKVGQDLIGYQYWINDQIKCIRARIFNTTGPRKIRDVASDFTRQAVLYQKREIEVIKVGNLTTERSITDVRDLISALTLLAEKGIPGEAYNICGSKSYKISYLIELIEDILSIQLPLEMDPKLLRTSDEPIIFGDSTKLIEQTGWKQNFTLKQTLTDMINYWNDKL